MKDEFNILQYLSSRLGGTFESVGSKLWDIAFEVEPPNVDYLDLLDRWLFLLTKVFKIASRVEGGDQLRLTKVGAELFAKGLEVLFSDKYTTTEAKRILLGEFQHVLETIHESDYEFQKADDWLLGEVLEE